MKNTFKKVLFSLWAIGLVWIGIYGTTNAQLTPDPNSPQIWNVDITTPDNKLINVITLFINRILWLLATIALVICLRWWFQMLTAAGDENKYKKWFTILKQAWIWLIIIWLSWLIVRLIFWVINTMTA